MLSVYHVPTAYLIASLVFLALPVLSWFTLRAERAVATRWSAVGGVMIGAGLMALGLRQSYPDLLPFHTGYTLVMLGLALQLHSLALQLGQSGRLPLYLGFVLAGTAVKEVLLRVLPHSHAHYLFGYALLAVVFLLGARLAGQIASTEGLSSARWLSRSSYLAAAAFALRTLTGLLALSEPQALNNQLSGILTTFLVVTVALMNNFCMVGMYLERSHQRNARLRLEEERQRAAAELTAQVAQLDRQRSMGELAAGLAHELGQPVTGILMDASMLQQSLARERPQAPELQTSAQSILDQASRVREILQGIRNFIQPTRQAMRRLDLQEVIAVTRTMLAPALRSSGAQLRVHGACAQPWVQGDMAQLSQVLLNLVRNAIQAQRAHMPLLVELTLREAGDMLEMVLEDNGQGMSDEQLSRSQAPFYTTKPDGLGVGLAISRRIMEHHGGSLQLAHATSGQGVRVTLRLPKSQAQAHRHAQASARTG